MIIGCRGWWFHTLLHGKARHVEILRFKRADLSEPLRRPRARASLGADAWFRRCAAPGALRGGVELAAA
jgi:hypothetical protein